jgi:hypothetical protein
MFSPGAIIFNPLTDHTTLPPGTPTGAFNGTSINATKVQLGQPVGTVGDPAQLTADVEIPDPGANTVFFGKNDGFSDVVGINPSEGISIGNAGGFGILIFNFGLNFEFYTPTPTTLGILFGSPSSQLLFDAPTTDLFYTGAAFIVTGGGLGAGIRIPATAPVLTFAANDFTLVVDTSGGNCVVNMTPANLLDHLGNILKKTSDFNTITLTATTGLIFANGTSATTFVFSGAGESISFHCDGVNIYII